MAFLSRKCLWIGGFSLGFVLWCARWAGRLCTNQYQFCTTLLQRGDGAAATRSVSENSNMKFEFAVQDVIKTPNLKPPQSRDTFAMNSIPVATKCTHTAPEVPSFLKTL